jgi:hypothetical protein
MLGCGSGFSVEEQKNDDNGAERDIYFLYRDRLNSLLLVLLDLAFTSFTRADGFPSSFLFIRSVFLESHSSTFERESKKQEAKQHHGGQ